MRFQCPECHGVVAVENSDLGTMVQCGHCSKIVRVPTMRVCPGAVVGDFIIEKELGRGGMGIVYKAHQISLDRPAALKVLSDAYANNAEFVVGFIKEARAAAKLNHPHIVQAYAVGEDDGVFYLAMEYIDGETMKGVLKREERIPVLQAINIIQQIAEALSSAWTEQKLIHRDIKPDNIMLTSNGRAKLADLGLARVAGDIDDSEDDEVMGTPQYISPEHLTGAPMDVRSDIYSLGATFYHFVTGRFPFEGRSGAEIAQKHITTALTPPSAVNPAIPECVSKIIEKMMAKNPIMRYQDADALVDDLRIARKLVEANPPTEPDNSNTASRTQTRGQMRIQSKTQMRLHSKTQARGGNATQTGTTSSKTVQMRMVPDTQTVTKDRLFSEETLTQALRAQKRNKQKPLILAGIGVAGLLVLGGLVFGLIHAFSSGDDDKGKKSAVTPKKAPKEAKSSAMTRQIHDILAYAELNKRKVQEVHEKCEAFLATFKGTKLKAEEKALDELLALYSKADELLLREARDKVEETYAKDLAALSEKLEKDAEAQRKRAAIEAENKRKAEEWRKKQEQINAENQRIMNELRPRLQNEKNVLLVEIFEYTRNDKFKAALKAAEDWKVNKVEKRLADRPTLKGFFNYYMDSINFTIAVLKDLEEIHKAAFEGEKLLEGLKITNGNRKLTVIEIGNGKLIYKDKSAAKALKFDKLTDEAKVELVQAAAKKVDKASRLHFYYILLGEAQLAKDTFNEQTPEAKRESVELQRQFREILKSLWPNLKDGQKKRLREKYGKIPEFRDIINK